MDVMNGDIVAGLVEALWPVYTKGHQVKVERLARAPSCRLDGMVFWNERAGRWHVLANKELEPLRLLQVLGHELGHVVNGDLEPGRGASLEDQRAYFVGAHTFGTLPVAAGWERERADPANASQEQAANAWGARFARVWGETIEVLDGAARAAMIKALRRIKR